MKKLLTLSAALVLVLGLAACNVEKTGEGQYEVETPTSEEVTSSAETAGDAIQEGARDAAQATGTALERAGQEIQDHSQPGDQSDDTVTTTTTTRTTTTTTTNPQ